MTFELLVGEEPALTSIFGWMDGDICKIIKIHVTYLFLRDAQKSKVIKNTKYTL